MERFVLVGVGVEDVGDAVVDAPLEPAVQVLVGVFEAVDVVVADVGVRLSRVVATCVEVVVRLVLLLEETPGVPLDEIR